MQDPEDNEMYDELQEKKDNELLALAGAEYRDYPDFAEPVKCFKCGETKFQRMVRKTIPLKEWKRDLKEAEKKLKKLPFRISRTRNSEGE